MSEPQLQVFLLGPPEVKWGGDSVAIPRRQLRAMLYIFGLHSRLIPREQLYTLLWATLPDDQARRHLTRLLTNLRSQLPDPSLLVAEGNLVGLDARRAWSDAWAFDHLKIGLGPAAEISLGEEGFLRAAVDLYRDELLSGFDLPGNAEFEGWLSQQRYQMEQAYLNALARLVELCAWRGEFAAAIAYAQRYLAVDAIAEDMHRRLIELFALGGNRPAALRQFERCAAVLEGELGVRPLPETRAVYEAALHERSLAASLPLRPAEPAHLLPPSPGAGPELPFIGRADALDFLQAAFDRACRGQGSLVLLSGEEGIGKSRLLRQFSASAAAGGGVVMAAAGSPDGQSSPFHTLRALRELFERPIFTNPASQAVMFEELWQVACERLEALPVQPLVLILDDLHLADPATLDWLAFAGRRMAARRLLVAAAYDSDAASRIKPLREKLLRSGGLSEFALRGFDLAQVGALLSAAGLGCGAADNLTACFARLTGGNPFFMLETLRENFDALARRADAPLAEPDPAVLPVPAHLRAAIAARIGRLNPLARQVLDASAVFAEAFGFDLVHLTAGRRDLETINGLDELAARGLLREQLGDYTFVHELVRQVTLDEMSFWRRRLLQRRAAAALKKVQVSAVQGAPGPSEPAADTLTAIRCALEAGQQALASDAYPEARAYLDRALELLNSV